MPEMIYSFNGKDITIEHLKMGILNADMYSPASSAQSTKRWVRRDAYVSGSL